MLDNMLRLKSSYFRMHSFLSTYMNLIKNGKFFSQNIYFEDLSQTNICIGSLGAALYDEDK